MAYCEVDMWEILEILRRIAVGETQADTARGTGKDRKTVRNYIRRARSSVRVNAPETPGVRIY